MSEERVLALCFDAPLQSWGVSSRFQRRSTVAHPTRSAIAGMFCAAAGAAKGSARERDLLEHTFPRLRLSVVDLPKSRDKKTYRVRRLGDFHTVLGTRRASGKKNRKPVVTRRQYLLDSRFAVLLEGPETELRQLAHWIQSPGWGIWFGRKCCLPAAPVFRGIYRNREEALKGLGCDANLQSFTRVEEAGTFEEGTDTYMDRPLSFGRPDSSCEGRAFAPRRVRVIPAGSE